jgi:hypothetical protein
LYISILISSITNPIHVHAKNDLLQVNTSLSHSSSKLLSERHFLGTKEINKFNISVSSKTNISTHKLDVTLTNKNKLFFDGSYLNVNSGMLSFGVGAVDRNWSLSPKRSLILSSNSRPIKSIYLSFNNKKGLQSRYGSWLGPISIEFFNGITRGTENPHQSMLMGTRIVIKPINKLNFEFVRTAQWGGDGFGNDLKDFLKILSMRDSNIGSNANVNQIAGIGMSYNLSSNQNPLYIYNQIVGEDEAGNLPSCLMYLVGLQWKSNLFRLPTTLGIESVDTRIDTTKAGFCGPNTAYNNNTYKYTNYGKVIGANIDTEGKEIEIYGNTLLKEDLSINYSHRFITINDTSWYSHRLSTIRETGSITSIELIKKSNQIEFSGKVKYQNLLLDKAGIRAGLNISTKVSIRF